MVSPGESKESFRATLKGILSATPLFEGEYCSSTDSKGLTTSECTVLDVETTERSATIQVIFFKSTDLRTTEWHLFMYEGHVDFMGAVTSVHCCLSMI